MKNFKNVFTKPSRESQPWAIWIWNLTLTKHQLLEQVTSLIDQGFGGVAIRPGRDMFPAYLSEEFFELFDAVLSFAHEKNIGVRIADDFSLPWSGALTGVMNQSKKLRAQQLHLVSSINPAGKSELQIPVDDPENTLIIAARLKDNCLSLSETKIVSTRDTSAVVWKSSPGDWKLLVLKKTFINDPAGGYIPNPFNLKTAQLYIQMVLEPFKNSFAKYIPSTFEGFINELPACIPAEDTLPWDDDLVVKFRAKYKKDLLKLLPALFMENCPQSAKIRYQVYSFMYESMHERFTMAFEGWAKKSRLSQWIICPERNTYHHADALSCTLLPADQGLSAVGIQNADGSEECYPQMRLVADSNFNEFRRETLSVVGRNRLGTAATVQSLKSEIDVTLLAGPSRILIDGCFSNVDQRSYIKTPCNSSWYSPGWEHTKSLCMYIARSQEMLRDVHWNCPVAILSPEASIRTTCNPAHKESVMRGWELFRKTLHAVERCGIRYDIISENLLTSCTIRTNGEFGTADRIRKGNYQVLLIPFAPWLSRETLSFIEKLVQKDGVVYSIDEAPKGTIEDGTSATITTRIDKIFNSKKGKAKVIAIGEAEEKIGEMQTAVRLVVSGKPGAELFCSWGSGEGYELYVIHNRSESKEYNARLTVPENKHFAMVNCESGELHEIENVEHDKNGSILLINASPKSTYFIIASQSRIASQSPDKQSRLQVNPFTGIQRSYRIVFKDQWTFEPRSLNALPLTNWNVRIGLSRESGGFSHFYESYFQVNALPKSCFFVLNGLGGLLSKGLQLDSFIELNVNGLRINGELPRLESNENELKPEVHAASMTILRLFGKQAACYDISNSLTHGFNRVSLRTTGLATDPHAMVYPPVIMGNFAITKGQNGWALDRANGMAGHSSWTKHGYPYLSGMGIYSQSFEIPSEYEKLVLRLSQVSGTTDIRLNEKPLGVFNWHPMEMDVTSFCEQKRNELVISVVNTMDNLLKMSRRPSGLIGEVYLDVY